ncbi:MAG TPA: hypothetical protein VKT77_17560 [Chthonomonadaceae bacterium]|nr:hypothetical protein [Chthonomonadaceae bacterium]
MYRSRWTRLALFTCLSLLLAAGATVAKAPRAFTVHEWGTFLAMNDSDGVTLDGMYHEEHALPGFVHARSKDQLRVPTVSVKGETPVIYFYTDEPLDVSVEVKFPQGIWTQWYPQARYNGPSTAELGTPPALRQGHIRWQVHVTPAGRGAAPALPKTPAGSLWDYARNVDAAYVRPADGPAQPAGEAERFLFYRGLGTARLPLRMVTTARGILTCDRDEAAPMRHLFLIRVEHGRATYRYEPAIQPGQSIDDAIPSLSGAMPQAEFEQRISDDLAGRLVEAGLFPKEARAMVNTWRQSYFDTDGIRVLTILPQEWTDRFIPLTIEPKPARTVRVIVGRLEVLTPEREAAAASAIRDLASADADRRERAFTFLRDQGRYLEPILRRAARTAPAGSVRSLCERLLLTEFVTELQSAVNGRSAPQVSQVSQIRSAQTVRSEVASTAELDARAQLAALLTEVGLRDQAAEEARRIQPEVKRMQAPDITNSAFRPYVRIRARTAEALGDEAGAARWYGEFVRFGSQLERCGHCHGAQGPRQMADYRDWWAGRRFAQLTARTESLDAEIARRAAELRTNPGDTAARMMLAYLYQQKGDGAAAERQWSAIDSAAAKRISRSNP